jgi:hypothetical protein
MKRLGMTRLGVVAGIALAAMFSVLTPASAGASTSGIAVCNGSGKIIVNPATGGGFAWTLNAAGSCPALVDFTLGQGFETQTVSLVGSGTSSTLGFCDKSLLVQNLVLNVTVTFTGTITGKTLVQHQVWSLPLTLYPLVTPVLISGDAAGASVLASHVFLDCSNTGIKPALNVAWAQTVPNLNQ